MCRCLYVFRSIIGDVHASIEAILIKTIEVYGIENEISISDAISGLSLLRQNVTILANIPDNIVKWEIIVDNAR